MRQRTIDNIFGFLCGIILIFVLALAMQEAEATDNRPPDNRPPDREGQPINVQAQATSEAGSESTSAATSYSEGSTSSSSSQGGTASATNDGVTVEGDRVENNSSNVVLVPNNNTESCLRVFGLAFGRNGESAALGIPWRSKKCDFEQAADDAFAGGERDLGWFWKCHNKNLYQQFRQGKKNVELEIESCHARMLATTSTDDVIRKLEKRLSAADDQLDMMRRHGAVCDESLSRCEQHLYNNK